MKTRRYQCQHCDAEYWLRWELDEDYYEARLCPFCGENTDDPDYRADEEE